MFGDGRTTDRIPDGRTTATARREGPRVGLPWRQIAVAGSLAAVLRALAADGDGWATLLAVNVAGCLLLGVLVARGRATPVMAGGFCGSLTTFSGVMLQARTSAAGASLGATSAGGALALPPGLIGALTLLTLTLALGLAAFLAGRRFGGAPAAPATAEVTA